MLADVFTAKPIKTFGTLFFLDAKPAARIGYTASAWMLKAQPHVMMELKRLFPGYRQRPAGEITLADTPETAYRIAWCSLAFPLEMTPSVQKRLEQRVQERQDTRRDVETILNGGEIGMLGGYEPAIELYPHQKEAAALANRTGRLLLLDETGAMKTGWMCFASEQAAWEHIANREGNA
jgi:hypothetical protein